MKKSDNPESIPLQISDTWKYKINFYIMITAINLDWLLPMALRKSSRFSCLSNLQFPTKAKRGLLLSLEDVFSPLSFKMMENEST